MSSQIIIIDNLPESWVREAIAKYNDPDLREKFLAMSWDVAEETEVERRERKRAEKASK